MHFWESVDEAASYLHVLTVFTFICSNKNKEINKMLVVEYTVNSLLNVHVYRQAGEHIVK